METRSAKYPATPAGVKRGLKAAGLSQNRAAKATAQSPALVSGVLSKKITSQPCLDKLAALISRTVVGLGKAEAKARNGAAAVAS